MDKPQYGAACREVNPDEFKKLTANQRKPEALRKVGGLIKGMESRKNTNGKEKGTR